MSYFTSEFLAFFKELSKNNSKLWFDQNRDRYEKSVKEPFSQLVEEMIVRIHQDNPEVLIRPSEAIFRINRDIRFSSEKTPYKTHMAALISPAGRKARDMPGFYFQAGSDGIKIYSGVHQVQKDRLFKIRSYISNNLSELETIIKDKKFINHYKEIQGEKNKRLPSEFETVFEKQPLIANKDFYVIADIKAEHITKPDLSDILMAYYQIAKPLLTFLNSAIVH